MKTCATCRRRKTEREFYEHANMRDGRLNKCIVCYRAEYRARAAERFARTNPWAAGTRPRRAESAV